MDNLEVGDIVAGLDIGSSALRLIIASKTKDKLVINHINEIETDNIVNGEIIDVDKFSNEIIQLINKNKTHSININLSSKSIMGLNYKEPNSIKGRVSAGDIEDTIISSETWDSHTNKYRVFIPNKFKINNGDWTKYPIGEKARRIIIQYHLLTINKECATKARNAILKSGLEVKNAIIGISATADFLLSNQQKQQGIGIIDLGADLINFIVFQGGDLALTKSIPLNDYMIENEIIKHYNCSMREAKRLKEKYGFIDNIIKPDEDLISFYDNSGVEKYLSNYDLSAIITKQYGKIFNDIKNIFNTYNIDSPKLKAGIILIGGNSQIANLRQFAYEMFGCIISISTIDNNFLNAKNIAPQRKLINNYKYINALSILAYHDSPEYLKINNTSKDSANKFSRFINSIKNKID